LYETVFGSASKLPDFAEIYPGHGAGSLCGKAIGSRDSSTIGYERRFNEMLKHRPEPQWIESVMKDMPPAPPYFKRMKKINVQGPPLIGRPDKWPGRKAISPRQAHELSEREDVIVLDTRSKEAFAAKHVAGSINIPLDNNMPTWAGWVLPEETRLVLVLDDAAELDAVLTHLLRVGYDRIEGYIDGGMWAWEDSALPTDSLELIDAQTLAGRLSSDAGLVLVDVRSDGEWEAGHIEGARHVPAGLLPQQLREIPRERPVAVICGSGFRASIAASLLKRHGYRNVANVAGGMTAWKAARK
jgi:hydroxyacylglutathione hydrolase